MARLFEELRIAQKSETWGCFNNYLTDYFDYFLYYFGNFHTDKQKKPSRVEGGGLNPSPDPPLHILYPH